MEYKLNFEKEMLGIYLSGHPLAEFEEGIERIMDVHLGDLKECVNDPESCPYKDGDSYVVVGIVVKKTEKTTRNNNMMAFITVEDLYDTMEIIVFPNVYDRLRSKIKEDAMLIVSGSLNFKEDEDPKLIANNIMELNQDNLSAFDHKPRKRKNHGKLYLKFKSKDPARLMRVKSTLKRHPGNADVIIYVEDEGKKYKSPDGLKIHWEEALLKELEDILGKGAVKFV